MLFGKKIRELKDENGVLQRQLAAPIADDTPKRESNVESHSPEEVSVTPEALAKL